MNNERLFDISTRIAFYVERVKSEQSYQFNVMFFEIAEAIKKILSNVKYRTFDGLPKFKINKIITELNKQQSKIYSKHIKLLIENLKKFMAVDLELNRYVWISASNEISETSISEEETKRQALFWANSKNDSAWATIRNTPIAANGLFLLPFINLFSNTAQASISNEIRKSWANKLSIEQTLNNIVGKGSPAQGTPYQLARLKNQADAVIHTAMAHVATLVLVEGIADFFDYYAWYSVMDNRTTEICISRNLKIYRVGKGPLPPGHIRCRSHIGPVTKEAELQNESLAVWLNRQPKGVQDDVKNTNPLSFDKFGEKTSIILSR